MATPADLKHMDCEASAVRRSSRRKLKSNAENNDESSRREKVGFLLPTSDNLNEDSFVLTRSRSRNLKSLTGDCVTPSSYRERKNIRRKKNTLVVSDLSEYSTIPVSNGELEPKGSKIEATCSIPSLSLKNSQDSQCVEGKVGKASCSPHVFHCETEMLCSTTVTESAQDDPCIEIKAEKNPCSPVPCESEVQSSTAVIQNVSDSTSVQDEEVNTVSSPVHKHSEMKFSTAVNQNGLNCETSTKAVNTSKNVTPFKLPGGSSSKVTSATKLPNFANIHKKQFKKMESVIEWKQRKQIRAERMLLSPTAKSPFCFMKAESSPFTENVFKFTATQKSSIEDSEIQDSNIQKKTLKLEEIKIIKSKENVAIAQAKECIVKKLPQVSREQKRAQDRTYLKGVRLNKRFLLQMEMRKLR